MNKLPGNVKKKQGPSVFTRYKKQVPGHQLQVDVKFLFFNQGKNRIKRFQYTAIDDATRIRVLKIYEKHNQDSSIHFIDHVIKEVPFRIKQVRTDNGHEFQYNFHQHLFDLGIEHVYIKPASPHLNGRVERSHRVDKAEFYQLLSYKGDVDLEARLKYRSSYFHSV